MSSSTKTPEKSTSEKKEKRVYSLEIRAYAKMLFLLVDEKTGKRLYTHQGIVDKLQTQFGEAPARVTFGTWAKEWENELEVRESIIGGKDSDLLKYWSDTKNSKDSAVVTKAIVDHLKMSLVFHSKRMHKYGALEDTIISSITDGQSSSSKYTLIKKLLEDNPDARRLKDVLEGFKLVDIQRGVVESNKSFVIFLEKLEKWLTLAEATSSKSVVEMHQDSIWEYEPVDIEEFLESDKFLGEVSKGFYKCVVEDTKAIFYGNPRKLLERRRFKDVILKEAYGTGKSTRASIASTYLTYLILCLRDPAKFFGLLPASKITITNVSVTKEQAKDVVFSKIKNLIDYCPWFREHGYMPDPRSKLVLRFDPADSTSMDISKIHKNIYIKPGSSSEFSAVGYDVICCIIDEATAYGIENGKDKAEIIYNTLQARIASRFKNTGIIITAGNPHHVDDFLERLIKAAEGKKDAYVVKNRSVWEAKYPDYDGDWFYFDYGRMKFVDETEFGKECVLKIPITYEEEFTSDPELSVRNLAGISLESISRFISNVDKIDEMFVTSGRKNPVEVLSDGTVKFDRGFGPINRGVHAVHIDTGITGDACGIALGHVSDVEKGNYLFYVDCLIRLKGSKSNPNILEDIRSLVYQLSKMGFNIGLVSLDGYQSTDFVQIMKRKGYDASILSVDKSIGPYIDMRQALYEGRIDCPFHDFLKYELRTIENINNKKVNHPINGSKDISDALTGVLSALIANVPVESISSDKRAAKNPSILGEKEEKKVRTPEEVFNDMLSGLEEEGTSYADNL
jgi:hypothetical protein